MSISSLTSHITLLHEISATPGYNGSKEAPSLEELQKLLGFGTEPCPAWSYFEQSVQNKQLQRPFCHPQPFWDSPSTQFCYLLFKAICTWNPGNRGQIKSHQYLLFIWTRKPKQRTQQRTLQILPTSLKTEVIYLKVLSICHSHRQGKRIFVIFVTALMIKWINTYIQCKKKLFLDLKVISVQLDRSIHSEFLPSFSYIPISQK